MPPLVIVALGALSVATLARVVVKGRRRINEALARHQPSRAPDRPGPAADVIDLVRDPATGEYRPRRR